ncbi:hypothetical protein BJ322DRAFT_1011254 [Thelephora terrestris]|uniref:Capsular associated protein n=1 Tax=Thelephora terrestris TaxID=56493 RepID=A0A9P6H7H4_9AGAM|nr:hypothetical protein BJ322DRAFT_1011254 [Thelephora terrestris]
MSGRDPEKQSRLSRRSFGVTNRIWLILSLIISVVLLSRYIFSSSSSSSAGGHRLLSSDLKPKNYLNVSELQHPGSPFPFCPVFGEGDEVGKKYGALGLTKSRLHLGSGARIQRVINKAMGGFPVTISVIGGSVSACHGAGTDPLSPSCYPSKFFHWWNTVFPHPASELTNGAMRRTNSDYYSFCSSHHIPDMTDLIIIELDADDNDYSSSLERFEILVRSILMRQDHPAVVILGHFSPQIQREHGFASPDHWHNVVAQFYDIPHISTKPILYSAFIEEQSSVDRYFADAVLANPAGHDILADVLISYFQSQVCSAWAAATGQSFDGLPPLFSPIVLDNSKQPTDARGLFGGAGQRKGSQPENKEGDIVVGGPHNPGGQGKVITGKQPPGGGHIQAVPLAMIDTRPGDLERRAYEEPTPFCASANDLVNPLPTSIFTGTGWAAYHPPTGTNAVSSASHYWYSSQPLSRLRVTVTLGAGDVGVYYLKEPKSVVGIRGSSVNCWVDDNYEGRVQVSNAGDVGEPTPTLQLIDTGVSWGSHYVECELAGEEGDRNVPSFRILGIFAT